MLKHIDFICWGIIKEKFLYKISGLKLSSRKLKLCGCAVQPPPMKALMSIEEHPDIPEYRFYYTKNFFK